MMMAFCSTKLRIAILQDEIALWEKRCDTEPRSNLYYGYIRDMMTNRVEEYRKELDKELSASSTVDDTTEDGWENEGGMALPDVDDNSSRVELDNWKERYKGYREWKKKIPMKDLARLEEEYNMKGNNTQHQYHFFRGRHDGCFDDRDWNFDKDNKMV